MTVIDRRLIFTLLIRTENKFPTVSWKLFSCCFIDAVMTVHASSIAEYGRVAINNNLTLVSGITQYTLTH